MKYLLPIVIISYLENYYGITTLKIIPNLCDYFFINCHNNLFIITLLLILNLGPFKILRPSVSLSLSRHLAIMLELFKGCYDLLEREIDTYI